MTSAPEEIVVRPERPDDADAIRALHDAAFGRPAEGLIADGVRGTAAFLPDLSLVACDASGDLVGHVLVSRGRLERLEGGPLPVLVLGPIGVRPDRQRQGIGAALMRRAIGAAVARAEPVIALVGHASYYPRFGFEPARRLGIDPPGPWPDVAWMVLRLPAWTQEYRGTVQFPEAFGAS